MPPAQELRVSGLELKGRIQAEAFSVRHGECVVLCGPNGSGKSSLLRLLAGLEHEYGGEIFLDGRELRSLKRLDVASQLAWLPQRPQLIEPTLVEAIVAAARYRFSEPERLSLENARDILSDQGAGHLVGRLAGEISGGELQRVLIASLIAQDVPFLLVDEPANHLDPKHQLSTYEKLGQLWQSGKTVIIVSHDVRLAQRLGPARDVRVACIKGGRLTQETSLAAPELGKELSELYEVEFIESGSPGGLAVKI